MDAKTLEALHGSIRKWERIVAGTGKDDGSTNCPLCRLFCKGTSLCVGCPVRESTGRIMCDGSPYGKYARCATTDNAQAELDFLKSLLPRVHAEEA